MRFFVVSLGAALASAAVGQGLTLEQALEMARTNNGDVRSAALQYQASRADARAAYSSYFPLVVPSFQYDVTRIDTYTGPFRGLFEDTSSTSGVTASWLIADSGFRDASYRRAALSRDITGLNALTALRNVLFGVHRAFYEALRSGELLKVQQATLSRAEEIERQARAFADQGAGAQKDVLQATADKLNAKASELAARNGVSTSFADLKAILGLPRGEELDALSAPEAVQVAAFDITLEQAMSDGLAHRPDLVAQRYRVDAQRQSVRLARIDEGLTWTVDARHTRAFSPDPFDSSALVFQVSIPIFDGLRSRSNVQSSRFVLESERATLTQAERDAIAEIESSYKAFAQNRERLEAASAAREAARLNFQAAFESRQEGAGDLIEVLTAQVSLATAESNYIEAYYDTLISRVQLMLVTGQELPGERP
ncbi:MAG: TolC family protein [Fimbriimonadaceae bacterium]